LRWGGHGYGHVMRNVPALMRRLDFPDWLVDALMRTTPLGLLTLRETHS
jgi:phosphotriesterase-related protein